MNNYISMSNEEILNFVKRNNNCVLAISDNNLPYVVPMFYKYTFENNELHIIMKSKNYGKKMRCMHNNSNVCIGIFQTCFNSYKTVLLYGLACIEDCNDDSIIKVCITDATGRIYC